VVYQDNREHEYHGEYLCEYLCEYHGGRDDHGDHDDRDDRGGRHVCLQVISNLIHVQVFQHLFLYVYPFYLI
jgi:hypothetical protein